MTHLTTTDSPTDAGPTVSRTTPSDASRALEAAVEAACACIAPAWPLDRQIAVNPYWGLVGLPIEEAAARLASLSGTRLTMPRAWFRARLADGTFTERHIVAALEHTGSTLDLTTVLTELDVEPRHAAPYPSLVVQLDGQRDLTHAVSYEELVTRQLSQACAAYVDDAQATWSVPREGGFYATFRRLLHDDAGPRILAGVASSGAAASQLPEDPRALVQHALAVLKVPSAEHVDYLTALLLSIHGWASAFAFARWEARLTGGDDDDIVHLVAARLAWELLLYRAVASDELLEAWRRARTTWRSRPATERRHAEVDWVLQRALEIAYQDELLPALSGASGQERAATAPSSPAEAQLVFCIDVRSEVVRRCIERVRPGVQTHGFAGFFGLPVAYQPLQGPPRPQLPGLLAPTACIVDAGARRADAEHAAARAATYGSLQKELSGSPASMFSWVETLGLGAAFSLVRETLGFGDGPADELRRDAHTHALVPTLVAADGQALPLPRRVQLAAGILRGMGLTSDFARSVVLFGHCATSDNNPQAAGLQCGACGGQSGEVNARALAGLLNDASVRAALVDEGIVVPEATRFVAGLHDTTTDELRLFDLATLPDTHRGAIASLRESLDAASNAARRERATRLGLAATASAALPEALRRRSRDWYEVRPEWGLARNAAFIAAPRGRTRGIDLGGRAFLHDYHAERDTDATVLEQIMTAPMVVAHFINMQYYASTVDNLRYGSGNKVLHNVVGGSVGVFEGASGDLRIGLARQSLHDGQEWVHVPQRLSVFLEAPRAAIDGVIAKHELVRHLVEHEWLYLFAIEPGGTQITQWTPQGWQGGVHA